MKPGTKLKSTVCNTEVMVIKGTGLVVECGGAPMTAEGAAEKGSINPDFATGTLIGKRYVTPDGGVELLCVKAGEGALAIDGQILSTKDAKPLPSSD